MSDRRITSCDRCDGATHPSNQQPLRVFRVEGSSGMMHLGDPLHPKLFVAPSVLPGPTKPGIPGPKRPGGGSGSFQAPVIPESPIVLNIGRPSNRYVSCPSWERYPPPIKGFLPHTEPHPGINLGHDDRGVGITALWQHGCATAWHPNHLRGDPPTSTPY